MSIERVDLVIGGMTCASCANRVEKRLNRLDGVTATVNFATEKARVSRAMDADKTSLDATTIGLMTEHAPPGPGGHGGRGPGGRDGPGGTATHRPSGSATPSPSASTKP